MPDLSSKEAKQFNSIEEEENECYKKIQKMKIDYENIKQNTLEPVTLPIR